jgi:hypothetical protein
MATLHEHKREYIRQVEINYMVELVRQGHYDKDFEEMLTSRHLEVRQEIKKRMAELEKNK